MQLHHHHHYHHLLWLGTIFRILLGRLCLLLGRLFYGLRRIRTVHNVWLYHGNRTTLTRKVRLTRRQLWTNLTCICCWRVLELWFLGRCPVLLPSRRLGRIPVGSRGRMVRLSLGRHRKSCQLRPRQHKLQRQRGRWRCGTAQWLAHWTLRLTGCRCCKVRLRR